MTKEYDTFTEYDADINSIWLYKLRSSYWKIVEEIKGKNGKDIGEVSFAIEHGMKNGRIGEWRSKTRVIAFEIDLLRNYEWAAVENVMRHEVAHVIVNDIFDISANGCPHGEAFKIALNMVGLEEEAEAETLADRPNLSSFKGSMDSPMVERIRKLLVHGNDKACTKEEAETFLRKAQELMMRHQVRIEEICGKEKFYISRPVGPKFKRFPSWLWTLVNLIKENYNIEAISMYCGGYSRQKEYRMEFFGHPDNLDIAEYIFHALLNQGKVMYKEFLDNHKQKCKDDEDYLSQFKSYGYRNRMSSASYLLGLYGGYSNKLAKDRLIIYDKIKAEDGALVVTDAKFLREMFEECYHPRTSSLGSSGGRSHAAYVAGRVDGAKLTLAKGVRSNGNAGRLLKM